MKKRAGFFAKNKRGQIWVETVVYTLIALVMIGLVLAFAKPKIEELQDKALIDQSINMMKEIDSTILTIGCPGNQRVIELGIKKGVLKIDGINNMIIFEMESNYEYSEPGTDIEDGNLVIHTEKIGSANMVKLTRDYSDSYDINHGLIDELKILSKSSVPYKLSITNEGSDNGKIIIDVNIM